MRNGGPAASLALIEALTADRDALARQVAALHEREQLYMLALAALGPFPPAPEAELQAIFATMLERAPDGIVISTIDGVITYANAAFQNMTGYGPAVVGMHLNGLIAPEERRFVPAVIQRLIQAGTWQGTRTYLRRDGGTFEASISLVVVCDADNQPRHRAGIIRDLTRQRRLEQEQLLLQEQVIAAQQSQLRDLRTPVLRLAPGVVVVPLTGSIDDQRAGELVDALIAAVARQPAAAALIDLGEQVSLAGPVVRLLLRAMQTLRLLGTQVVLTGVGPEGAAELADLGLEQQGVTVHSTLHAGVEAVLGRGAGRGEDG